MNLFPIYRAIKTGNPDELNVVMPVVQEFYGDAKETLGEGAERVEDTIREFVETRPYTTAMIALCAGWLIGRIGR